jgi:hypothetical protein
VKRTKPSGSSTSVAQCGQPRDHVVEFGQCCGELDLNELDLLRVAEVLELGHGASSRDGMVMRRTAGRGDDPPSGGSGSAPSRPVNDIAIRSALTLPTSIRSALGHMCLACLGVTSPSRGWY